MPPVDACLAPTHYVDAAHPAVGECVARLGLRDGAPAARAAALFRFVRDEVRYEFMAKVTPEEYLASTVLRDGRGFCVQKAVLLCAPARAARIPCALVLRDLVDHSLSPRIARALGTNVMFHHGLNALHVEWPLAARRREPVARRHGAKRLPRRGVRRHRGRGPARDDARRVAARDLRALPRRVRRVAVRPDAAGPCSPQPTSTPTSPRWRSSDSACNRPLTPWRSHMTAYDPFDPAVIDDPYPYYARLREESPVARVERLDLWVLSRHADVLGALRDPATLGSVSGMGLLPLEAAVRRGRCATSCAAARRALAACSASTTWRASAWAFPATRPTTRGCASWRTRASRRATSSGSSRASARSAAAWSTSCSRSPRRGAPIS